MLNTHFLDDEERNNANKMKKRKEGRKKKKKVNLSNRKLIKLHRGGQTIHNNRGSEGNPFFENWGII